MIIDSTEEDDQDASEHIVWVSLISNDNMMLFTYQMHFFLFVFFSSAFHSIARAKSQTHCQCIPHRLTAFPPLFNRRNFDDWAPIAAHSFDDDANKCLFFSNFLFSVVVSFFHFCWCCCRCCCCCFHLLTFHRQAVKIELLIHINHVFDCILITHVNIEKNSNNGIMRFHRFPWNTIRIRIRMGAFLASTV